MVNHETALELVRNKEKIARKVSEILMERFGDYFSAYDIEYSTLLEYSYNDISKLYVALLSNRPNTFGQYIAWQRSVMERRDIPLIAVQKNIEILKEVLKDMFSAEKFAEVKKSFAAAEIELSGSLKADMSYLSDEMPFSIISKSYLVKLLNKEIKEAESIIMDAYESGISIKKIFVEILQPVLYEVGRLWQINEITVAQEHFYTSVTKSLIERLCTKLEIPITTDKYVIISGIGRELHDVGITMLQHLFSMNSWRTRLIGSNTPMQPLITMVEEEQPDILAISATMTINLKQVFDLIFELKQRKKFEGQIIVGGNAFNLSPNLWKNINADGYAENAENAVSLAENLILA